MRRLAVTMVVIGVVLAAGFYGWTLSRLDDGGDGDAAPPEEPVREVTAPDLDPPPGPFEPDLVIMVTANTAGHFEDCGCPGYTRGGLARRSTIIRNLRDESDAPTLLLDAGNSLLHSGLNRPWELDQNLLRAEGGARLHASMGYDAMLLAPLDLMAGHDTAVHLMDAGAPWVSANLLDGDTGDPLVPPRRDVEAGPLRVSVIGSTWVMPDDQAVAGVRVENALETVRAQARAAVAEGADLVVLLSCMPPSRDHALMEEVPEVDLVISNEPARPSSLGRPRASGSGVQVQTTWRGKEVTVLRVQLKPGASGTIGTHRRDTILERWESFRSRLETLDVHAGDDQHKDALYAAERMREMLPEWREVTGHNLVEWDAIPLQRDIEEDTAVLDALMALRAAGREHVPPAPEALRPDVQIWAGSQACAECHREIWEFWRETPHAHALDTLREVDADQEFRCAGCHTVGWYKEGGFFLGDDPRDYAGVGCESCHGAGMNHINDPSDPRRIIRQPPRQVCETCHHPPRDWDFDFDSDLPHVGCGHR